MTKKHKQNKMNGQAQFGASLQAKKGPRTFVRIKKHRTYGTQSGGGREPATNMTPDLSYAHQYIPEGARKGGNNKQGNSNYQEKKKKCADVYTQHTRVRIDVGCGRYSSNLPGCCSYVSGYLPQMLLPLLTCITCKTTYEWVPKYYRFVAVLALSMKRVQQPPRVQFVDTTYFNGTTAAAGSHSK